jgi:hypothetical protein
MILASRGQGGQTTLAGDVIRRAGKRENLQSLDES